MQFQWKNHTRKELRNAIEDIFAHTNWKGLPEEPNPVSFILSFKHGNEEILWPKKKKSSY